MSAASRVAIVGMGGLFPSAATPDRLWADVLAGEGQCARRAARPLDARPRRDL